MGKPVLHIDLEIMSGTPVFVGTRVPFQTLIDYLEDGQPIRGTRIPVELIVRKLREGASEADLLEGYPRLTREDDEAARRYGPRSA